MRVNNTVGYKKMNRYSKIIIFILISIIFSCRSTEIKIGDVLPADAKKVESEMIMSSPSSLDTAYKIKRKDIEFNLAVDDKNTIKYIETNDPKFKTEEAVSVGDTYDYVSKLTDNKAYKISGWAYVLDMESGWSAAFVEGENATNEKLKPDSKVVFIYKN